MSKQNEMKRYNQSYMLFEYGYWFIGRYGKPMWKHLRFIPIELQAIA